MWFDIPIYNSGSYLILAFAPSRPKRWYDVTAVCDTDVDERLFGIELFLYEEPEINFDTIREQLHGFDNIEVIDNGLLYVTLRREPRPSHAGFGRGAFVGITQTGYLAQVVVPWIELGAATPVADPAKALAGLEFQYGQPPLYPEYPSQNREANPGRERRQDRRRSEAGDTDETM